MDTSAISSKANAYDVYMISEVDTALVGKANQSTTYTQEYVDNALRAKQHSNSSTNYFPLIVLPHQGRLQRIKLNQDSIVRYRIH